VSDAAGARFVKENNRFIPYSTQDGRGAVSIGSLNDDTVWFSAVLTWPPSFLLHARDNSDHAFGCKSTTLEAIAMLLPFLCCPSTLSNRDVVLLTDNEALIYGWSARRVKNDVTASILIRAIHLISSFVGCAVTIRHLPRLSTPLATLADALTRTSSTTPTHLAAIAHTYRPEIPATLIRWLDNPTEDWSLATSLLSAVELSLPHLT
jgi:hypothetical protein